jgi:long-chain acyl-CoA synthetase
MVGGYGITECSPLVSANEADSTNNFASAGKKLECIDWRIEDADSDGIGEIVVKGATVMLGYYKRPDLTAEVMRDGWFHTGDFGYINDCGEVVITGRKKNIIVLNNGKNIYPEELENKIQSLPEVMEVVVSGIRNEHGQDIGLAAEVYCGEENVPSEAELANAIAGVLSELPRYKQMAKVTVRTEPFPKTTTKKIKR